MTAKTATWWGVMNPQGQLSAAYSMRGLAESTIAGRQDGGDCWLVPVQVGYDQERPKPAPAKRGKR